jgi:hypothetical protein
MKYYIVKNRIKAFESELDSSLYDYTQLTEAQATFYEANATATIDEVLNLQLNVKSAEQLLQEAKQSKIGELQSYIAEQYETAIPIVMSSFTAYHKANATTKANFADIMLLFLSGAITEFDDWKYYTDATATTETIGTVNEADVKLAVATLGGRIAQLKKLQETTEYYIDDATTLAELGAITWNS